MTRRFWVSAALTVPTLLDCDERVPARGTLDAPAIGLELDRSSSLATPVVLWGGWPFFVRGWQSIVNRSLNMFTLIALGVGVAYVYQRRSPRSLPACSRTPSACTRSVGVYFEAAAVIVTLVLLGQVLELRARPDRRRDPRAARAGAENRAPPARRRQRRGRAARPGARRRSAARASRREGAGGRHVVEGRSASTSRWSPASRFRSRSSGATGSSARR